MNLFKLFQQFIQNESLFNKEHKLLLALSGGADSMVLASLLKHFEYHFEAAHVNFQLRGIESKEDEAFVVKYCSQHSIPLHIKQFDTLSYASENRIGIQEAARELRRTWFEELRIQNSFDYILTAHHANDQAETILFHLMRSSGSKGLAGMLTKKGNFIKPLLFAKKEDILKHAAESNIPFRTDSSNLKDDYTRNFIRHQIIPKFLSLQPAFIENTVHTGKLMEATHFYFQKQIEEYRKELLMVNENNTMVQTAILLKLPFPAFILFELIHDFGFNFIQCEAIINSLNNNHSGAMFYSGTHKVLINRLDLIISEPLSDYTELEISSLPFETNFGSGKLFFREVSFDGFQENCFWLDIETLGFPLLLRNWKEGDRFMPLGMNGSQKISDYFINHKVDRFAKNSSYVLQSNNQICALLPYQISDKNKLTETTKRYLKIEYKKRG